MLPARSWFFVRWGSGSRDLIVSCLLPKAAKARRLLGSLRSWSPAGGSWSRIFLDVRLLRLLPLVFLRLELEGTPVPVTAAGFIGCLPLSSSFSSPILLPLPIRAYANFLPKFLFLLFSFLPGYHWRWLRKPWVRGVREVSGRCRCCCDGALLLLLSRVSLVG